MLLRCRIDGLLLPAWVDHRRRAIVAADGDELFEMDRLECVYYDVIRATRRERVCLARFGYRLIHFDLELEAHEKTACVRRPHAVKLCRPQRINRS